VQWHRSCRNGDPTGELPWETGKLGDEWRTDKWETSGDTKDGGSTCARAPSKLFLKCSNMCSFTLIIYPNLDTGWIFSTRSRTLCSSAYCTPTETMS
jgi:hypothetical protein